jgi:acyl-CoA synthetase (AMP-forming)/AMP-acid ligase II
MSQQIVRAGWNCADVWERVADRLPDSIAFWHGDESLTWRQVDARANGLGQTLLAEKPARGRTK